MSFFSEPSEPRHAPLEVYELVADHLAGKNHPPVTAVVLTTAPRPSLFHETSSTHTRSTYTGSVQFLIPEGNLRGWQPGQPLPAAVKGSVARLTALATSADGGKARDQAARNGPFAAVATVVAGGLALTFAGAAWFGVVAGTVGAALGGFAALVGAFAAAMAREAVKAREILRVEDSSAAQRAVALVNERGPVEQSVAETPPWSPKETGPVPFFGTRRAVLAAQVSEASDRLFGAPPAPPVGAGPARRASGEPGSSRVA